MEEIAPPPPWLGAWPPESEVSSDFCLSMLATAALSKLLGYQQMVNGLLWYLLLQDSVESSETYNMIQKRGEGEQCT